MPSSASTRIVKPGGRQTVSPPDDASTLVQIGSTALLIPGFTFDFAKIASRASRLFPLLDLQLSIEGAPDVPLHDDHRDERHGLAFVRTITTSQRTTLPRLGLSPTVLQTIVDSAWSRRDRWSAFRPIRTLADRYSPDAGAVPTLLRAYVEEDLLQPFYDTTIPDPRLWSSLAVAADHEDFIQFITGYAERHPSTKATTELLFLLDKLAQGSFDTLTTLLDTDVRDLRWTAEASGDAYRLIRAIRGFYVDRLGAPGANREALKRRYDAVRLKILDSIVRTTPLGYRANDATFLMGAIEWKAGNLDAAEHQWRELQVRPSDFYAESSSYVLGILRERPVGTALSSEAAVRVTKIVDNEHARWLAYATARIQRFGYTADRY